MSTTFQISRGDVVVNDSSGQPKLVADDVKIRQDLRIALSTAARVDNIGAGLEDVVNGQAATASLVERQIERRVQASVANIQRLQDQFQRDQRPQEERLIRVATIIVTTVADDPTAFSFRAEFVTARSPAGPITLSGRIG